MLIKAKCSGHDRISMLEELKEQYGGVIKYINTTYSLYGKSHHPHIVKVDEIEGIPSGTTRLIFYARFNSLVTCNDAEDDAEDHSITYMCKAPWLFPGKTYNVYMHLRG